MEIKNEALKFLDPEEIVGQLEITPGSQIADFGCGAGFFSVVLAQKTGPEGKVFSLDVVPQALEATMGRAESLGLRNIVIKRVNLEKESGSTLEAGSLDWVILKDILFQNKNKKIILQEVFRVLKAGGRVLIVEWNDDFQGIGPALDLRIKKLQLKEMAEMENLNFEKEIGAGKFHYAGVFKK